jgi:hypothetical protein
VAVLHQEEVHEQTDTVGTVQQLNVKVVPVYCEAAQRVQYCCSEHCVHTRCNVLMHAVQQ